MKGNTFALIFLFGMVVIVGIAITLAMRVVKSQDVEILMKNGKYQAVVDSIGELLEDEPNNLRYQELAIKSLIKLDRYPEAKQQFQYVRQQVPDSKTLCPVIAKFLGEQGRYQLASEWLKESCTEDSPSVKRADVTESGPGPVSISTDPVPE